jgi:hypothetical protein
MKPMRTLLLSVLLAVPCWAGETWTGTAAVQFTGYSTLHDFEGKVNVPLTVKRDGGELSAKADAEVAKMDTDHDERDEKMRAMFSAAKHRFIDVEVKGVSESRARPVKGEDGKEKPGVLPLKLTIAGTSREIAGATTGLRDDGKGHVEFDLAFPVSLKEFGLKAPSALLGAVSVKDRVDVVVHVVLEKK